MSAQLSWDLALAGFELQGESLADLAVVTRVTSSWLWWSQHPERSGPLPLVICVQVRQWRSTRFWPVEGASLLCHVT